MTRRLKVAQVVTRFIAGAGGVALRGALALDPDRYDVTIFAADGGSLLAKAEEGGLEVVRLRHLVPELDPRRDLLAFRELVGHLREGGFDLVHTHSAKAGTLGRLAARRAKVAGVVHTFHGFPFHDFQPRAVRATYIGIERRLGRMTDQFLAVGGAVAADVVRLGIGAPERVTATVSTVDAGIPPTTPARRAEARLRLGLPDGAPVVGTVGRLDFQKAPLDFVAAAVRIAAERPEARFVWVGGGPLLEETKAAIAKAGLAGRFLLAGERNDVADLLPAFDVFAMSSLYEGLPCAVVEAMTCGIPVVATAVNAVPEVVVPGRTGILVPPAKPAALARAVTYLLANTEHAQLLATTARSRMSDVFEPDALGYELEVTYARALGLPRPSRGVPTMVEIPAAGGSNLRRITESARRSG